MLCVLVGRGRYAGGVDRPVDADGNPPPEIEIRAPRRFKRADPRRGNVYTVDVNVFVRAGVTRDGEPQYVLDRKITEEVTD
jgi:hypothetical protein